MIALLCALLWLLTLLPNRTPVAAAVAGTDPALEEILRSHLPAGLGTFGVAVKDLSSGRTAYVNPDEVFETASLYKVFVMVELYRQQRAGMLSLAEPGLLSNLEAMITVSDNDAAEALWRRVGINNINATMLDLGLPHSQVAFISTTTPREMGYLLERIALLRAVDAESSAAMIRTLGRQRINDRLPAGLPPGTFIAHKTGDLGAMTHDAGIVYAPSGPFVIVAMNKNTVNVYSGRAVEADLASATYSYLQDAPRAETPDPPLVFDPPLDTLLRQALPRGYGLAVKHLRTGQAALVNAEGPWPSGDPDGPWSGSARGTLLWFQWLGSARAPNRDGDWHSLEARHGQPGERDLAGGIPEDVKLAHRFGFDGYTASDAAIVFAPQGPYAEAVIARGDDGGALADVSRQVYGYFAEHTWTGGAATQGTAQ